FLPIGWVNDIPVTILPVFNNFEIKNVSYEWISSGAFSITYIITLPLVVYFALKQNRFALNVLGGVMIVCIFFIFAAQFITFSEAENTGNSLSYSMGYLPLILSIFLTFLGANSDKLPGKKE
ncbi:MAG: hypothetical protein D6707_09355, partial [Bacteroidetes bacterium]